MAFAKLLALVMGFEVGALTLRFGFEMPDPPNAGEPNPPDSLKADPEVLSG